MYVLYVTFLNVYKSYDSRFKI